MKVAPKTAENKMSTSYTLSLRPNDFSPPLAEQ